MPPVANRTSYLVLNAIPMSTAAWRTLTLNPLYNLAKRGRIERAPYVTGGLAYKHYIDYTSVTLPFQVYGNFQNDGTPNANVFEGFDNNLDYLRTNVLEAGSGNTISASWVRFDGTTLTASGGVFVVSFEASGDEWIGGAQFDLELAVPAGRFA